MRVNPKYSNTCAIQIGAYRKDPCYDCSHLEECDQHYDPATGDWDYPNPLQDQRVKDPKKRREIAENELRPGEKSVLTRIRNGTQISDKCTYRDILAKDKKIADCILALIDKNGGIYTDDLMRETGFTRESITSHLKRQGFVKTGGCASKYWIKVKKDAF